MAGYRGMGQLVNKYNQRKQRAVTKENEFYMQLLQLALPQDDPVQDELMSQLPQNTETLHSDELGDIVLPVSSIMAAQQVQQQQMVLATTAAKSFKTNSGGGGTASQTTNSNSAKHMLNSSNSSILSNRSINLSSAIGNGHTVNGVSPNASTTTSSNNTSAIVNGGGGINHIHTNNSSTSSSSGAQLRASHRKSLDRSDRNNENLSTMRSTNGGSSNSSTVKGDQLKRSATYQDGQLRESNKITETIITSSIWTAIWCRLFGSGRVNDNGSGSVNSAAAGASTFSLVEKRDGNHDDDEMNHMINDTDTNTNSMASIMSATSSSGRGSKEMRNSNMDGSYAQSTTSSTATSKHERDNSKTSNNNYSTDINSDTTYHANHFGNGKDKYFNKMHHQQNGNMSAMEVELNTSAQNQHENSNDGPEKSRGMSVELLEQLRLTVNFNVDIVV